jgi:hypothetical protein
MNKKERKRRLWKASFLKNYQQVIWRATEMLTELPACVGCFHIAHVAKRLSKGRLSVQEGIAVHFDQGIDNSPIVTSHCWNLIGGQRFDISPWGNLQIEYFSQKDGCKYEQYRSQTKPFVEVSKEILDFNVDNLEAVAVALKNGEDMATFVWPNRRKSNFVVEN